MTSSSNLCPHCFLPDTSSLIANWTFNGTVDEISPSQLGSATITNPNTNSGIKFEDAAPFADHVKPSFMQIRAPAYLNVPATTFIQSASFTVSWDLRLHTTPTIRTVLLTNWKSDMWQFMAFLDEDQKVGFHMRRNQTGSGDSDPDPGLVDVMTPSAIPIGPWVNIAFRFDRTNRTLYAYINGVKVNQSVVRSSITLLDLNPSNATHFQFGYQADSSSPNGVMNADVRNLRFSRLYSSTV